VLGREGAFLNTVGDVNLLPPRARRRRDLRGPARRPRDGGADRAPLPRPAVHLVQRPWDLAAVGEVLVDVTAAGLVPGEVVHGPVRLQPGGTPVNAAFAAAAIGASCVVVGRVGADPAGTMLRASLLVAGIDARLAGDGRTPTGIY